MGINSSVHNWWWRSEILPGRGPHASASTNRVMRHMVLRPFPENGGPETWAPGFNHPDSPFAVHRSSSVLHILCHSKTSKLCVPHTGKLSTVKSYYLYSRFTMGAYSFSFCRRASAHGTSCILQNPAVGRDGRSSS